MRIAISQSNYLPWLGYFGLIKRSDIFILHDGLAYSKGSYRNRNKIGLNRLSWITVPIKNAPLGTPISDVIIASGNWPVDHIKLIERELSELPYFQVEFEKFREQLIDLGITNKLSVINRILVEYVCELLDISTKLLVLDSNQDQEKNLRLVNLVKLYGGDTYISSILAKSYLDPSIFEYHKVKLILENYRAITKLFADKTRIDVSILQSILHLGSNEVARFLNELTSTIQVYLDPLTENDIEDIYLLQSNIHSAISRGASGIPESIISVKHWMKDKATDQDVWIRGIRQYGAQKCLGYVILYGLVESREKELKIGILLPNQEGTGAARQAIDLTLLWAFNVFSAKRVLAFVNLNNERSQNLFNNCGFMLQGVESGMFRYQIENWNHLNVTFS
jgi:RimJ/RimL family protein N-acetyltransferase